MLAVLAAVATPAAAQPRAPVVLAAASLREALTAIGDAWVHHSHPRPLLSFAASSAAARQIEAGAPADLFVSADEAWMDELAHRGLLAPGTRADVASNQLVLVAPAASRVRVNFTAAGLSALARGPVAMADPGAVPAGLYGKAALERLGAWNGIAPHVVRAENVRAALALVERGAAPFGIVYATDARASRAVRVVGTFPAASHPPIRYPLARTKVGSGEAEAFRRFLLGAEARAIFARAGFGPG